MVDDHHGPLQTLNGSSIVTLYESPTGNKSTKPLVTANHRGGSNHQDALNDSTPQAPSRLGDENHRNNRLILKHKDRLVLPDR
jgi:hypothetical protein